MPNPFQSDDTNQVVTQAQLEARLLKYTNSLQNGEIQIPVPAPIQANIAGGTNHYPDSDLNYSKDAVEVQGTLPATAGDSNQEAWRHFRQKQGDNLTLDAAHALKAVGHSLYAANEGANLYIPIWNRVDGWAAIGGVAGSDQYDVGNQLLSRLVQSGDTWFVLFRCGALTNDIVPADVQAYFGLWEKRAASEGWAAGGPFTLQYENKYPGAALTEYRVLAKTDSGVSILSNVLSIANGPNVLAPATPIKLFYIAAANSGFIEFDIIRKRAGVYSFLYSIRNTVDFQFNDVGDAGQAASGWPVEPDNAPRAFAQTRTLKIGAFGGAWQLNELKIKVPSTYDFSQSVTQYLRWGLTAPTAVNRQIGIDRLWFAPTFNEWGPDALAAFADKSYPVPSTSQVSGVQGSGGGVFEAPDPGSGGGTCILTRVPVLVRRKGRTCFRQYRTTLAVGEQIPGHRRVPYLTLRKRTGTVAEYYVIKSANGITYPCNARHELLLELDPNVYIQAQQVEAGKTKLMSWVNGRRRKTLVTSKVLVLKPAEVGTYVLGDPTGEVSQGRGVYVAGYSKKKDRGFFGSNVKNRNGFDQI